VKTGFRVVFALVFGFALGVSPNHAEELRLELSGILELSREDQYRVSLPRDGALLVSLGKDSRFFRGIELEIIAPPGWLQTHPAQGGLAVAVYADLDSPPGPVVPVFKGRARRFFYDTLPGKLRTVYQIPLREGHGLETSPYALVISPPVSPASFPIMVRLIPTGSGDLEGTDFQLSLRPILGDEGAVRLNFCYPEHLPGRAFTVLVDDRVIEASADFLLKEGEHRLLVLSDDYRIENRLFMVERGRVLDLSITLQDPTPLLLFEAPEQADIFLDNHALEGIRGPVPVEPGIHEVRFRLSDYSIARTIQVQRGKTYRIALTVDVDLSESE
jgi:hypothetical protein